jgi:ParB-like chromosome segregation protein Spo0J
MQVIKVKISDVKSNPNNPRIIKDDKFAKLVQSIKDFPEMLDIRPIVVNNDMVVLGGNMRLKACKEAGIKQVPIIKAENLSEEQQKEFIIKDNVSGGEWDWEMLANEWDSEQLEDWGLDVPTFATDVDYSILDDEDLSEQLEDMQNGVKKAIQIEFEAEHYNEAYELVKFWREKEAYVGGMIMECLKAEKEKI